MMKRDTGRNEQQGGNSQRKNYQTMTKEVKETKTESKARTRCMRKTFKAKTFLQHSKAFPPKTHYKKKGG